MNFNRTTYLVIATFVVIGSLLSYKMYIDINRNSQLRSDITNKTAAYQEKLAIKSILFGLNRNVTKLDAEYDKYLKLIPTKKSTGDFVVSLEQNANSNAILEDIFSFYNSALRQSAVEDDTQGATLQNSTNNSKSLNKLSFSGSFKGSINNLIDFLKSNEGISRYSLIESISYTKTTSEEVTKIDGSIYYKPSVSIYQNNTQNLKLND